MYIYAIAYDNMKEFVTDDCLESSGMTLRMFWYLVPSLRADAVAENNVCKMKLFFPSELMYEDVSIASWLYSGPIKPWKI